MGTNSDTCGSPQKGSYVSSLSSLTINQMQRNCTEESMAAALKLQKVYKSYRTRRSLADSAVVAELWWQAGEYAQLSRSTVSYFNYLKSETVSERWNRLMSNASRVGKGLSEDDKAKKLAFQHWVEAIDPRHRYGHNLRFYHEVWCKGNSGQPFFYWLDIGHGRGVDLEECPRSKLQQQVIKYLGPKERQSYEYIIDGRKILHKKSREPMDTTKGSQPENWIFVMNTSKKLYAGQKKKGEFHHSSFLAGGSTLAAGRIAAEDGVLKSISAYSGHYRPTAENQSTFLDFLTENGVNLEEVEIINSSNVDDKDENHESDLQERVTRVTKDPKPAHLENHNALEKGHLEQSEIAQNEIRASGYKRILSGGLPSSRAELPRKAVMQRINSKKATSSYQLGDQLSKKWSTGAGPRIGCLADYPAQLRQEVLEFLNLSPHHPTKL